jgi:hypothetical protein
MLRTKIDSVHGLRFMEQALVEHERRHQEATDRCAYCYNRKIDAEINAQLRGEFDDECDYLEPTVKTRPLYDENGFLDMFCSNSKALRFYVYQDNELEHELKAKARACYPVPW